MVSKKKRYRIAMVYVASAISLLIKQYWEEKTIRTPKRTSILNGNDYTQEILTSGNLQRQQRILRMPIETFNSLVKELRDANYLQVSRKGFTIERQVMQFLHIVSGMTNEMVSERFQCSGTYFVTSRSDSQLILS
jgi:hypothetical protein